MMDVDVTNDEDLAKRLQMEEYESSIFTNNSLSPPRLQNEFVSRLNEHRDRRVYDFVDSHFLNDQRYPDPQMDVFYLDDHRSSTSTSTDHHRSPRQRESRPKRQRLPSPPVIDLVDLSSPIDEMSNDLLTALDTRSNDNRSNNKNKRNKRDNDGDNERDNNGDSGRDNNRDNGGDNNRDNKRDRSRDNGRDTGRDTERDSNERDNKRDNKRDNSRDSGRDNNADRIRRREERRTARLRAAFDRNLEEVGESSRPSSLARNRSPPKEHVDNTSAEQQIAPAPAPAPASAPAPAPPGAASATPPPPPYLPPPPAPHSSPPPLLLGPRRLRLRHVDRYAGVESDRDHHLPPELDFVARPRWTHEPVNFRRTRNGQGHRDRNHFMLMNLGFARDPFTRVFDNEDRTGNNYDALLDLSERLGDVVSKGLSRAEINRLPVSPFILTSNKMPIADEDEFAAAADEEDNECRICLDNFVDKALLRSLPCCHRFHRDCIDNWISKNAVCPICRDNVKRHMSN